MIIISTQLSPQFLTPYPIWTKIKIKYYPDLKKNTKPKIDHITIVHLAKQMIKSKAYIGIHEHNNHIKFDSDLFPIVMVTDASCAMSMDINDFIESRRIQGNY